MIRPLLLFFAFALSSFLGAENTLPKLNSGISFTENKGQISDQNFNPRHDILFGGTDGSLSFYLKNSGISYQLYRVDSWKEDNTQTAYFKEGKPHRYIDKRTIYRIDVNWLGANTRSQIVKSGALPGYNNYYTASCPNGAMEVRSYSDIVYQNIYPGIDLKWYQTNGHLKYDYILAAGADHGQIQLEFEGAQNLSINSKGELIIKTPLGKIVEQAPVVTQNGKEIKAAWKINNNIVSFKILNADPSLPMVIDPGVRQWGTYYGGNSDDLCWASASDATGNIFVCGYTSSVGGTNIATVGSHQSAHSGNGLENALLAKFTPLGVRIWGTYYGGNVRDVGTGCCVDPSGNVFMSGNTMSSNLGAIATPGALQTVEGGSWDAFFVKFNGAGVRQWGTYYGAASGDYGYGCAADAAGNSYMCGRASTSGGTVFATPGSHQPAYFAFEDCFLVKFDPNGLRLWGTYYGGESTDFAYDCETDASGNVYMTGNAASTVNISTPGSFQSTYAGGNYDAFLVKFNGSGVRQWGTYYGGNADDRAFAMCRDANNGNLYIAGISNTIGGNGIATDGSHQSANGGGLYDGFIVQFNSLGMRQWGTYYGGSGDDRGNSCAVNILGYVYLAGYSNTGGGTVIATPGSHQSTFGGGANDAFLVQFNTVGTRLWATYYGGAGFDLGYGCSSDNNSNVYLCGLSDVPSGTIIATVGSQQSVYGGSTSDGFFTQFYDCVSPPAPANVTTPSNQSICTGNSVTLSANGFGTINWFNVPSGGVSIGSGTNFATPVLTSGTYTYYASSNTCTNSVVRTPITVTVHTLPTIFVTSSNSVVLCVGQTCTLFASGLSTYSWSGGGNNSSNVISPTVTTSYTITGADAFGCVNSAVISQSVDVCMGIKQAVTNGLQIGVHPNPTTSNITLNNVPSSATITVYDPLGQIILHGSNEVIRSEISLAGYPNGIYFILVHCTDARLTFKVLKN